MVKRVMIGVLALLSLSYACTAYAVMGRITTSDTIVSENSQKAIIFHNLKEEILILGTDLKAGAATTVLRFIPFPSEPVVSLVEGNPFQQVSKLMKQHKMVFFQFSKSGSSSVLPVEVTFSAKIGAHDVTVVSINEIAEFRRWVSAFLESKGLVLGDDYLPVEHVASDYIKRGIKYFVFDLVEITPEAQFVEPVAYRFKSNELYYPLKTSNTFGSSGGIDLTIISPVTLCDPLHSKSLPLTAEASIHVRSLTEEETLLRKVLGGNAMQASTSAQLSREDLTGIEPQVEKFFQENEPVFMQLIRYWGKYSFGDDLLMDISQAPREIIDEWNAGNSIPFDYSAFRELAKSSEPKSTWVADKKENATLILAKACLKATLAAIQMEIWRFEERFAAAVEGPGDPANAPAIENRIKKLSIEYDKYESMNPADYVVPEKKTIKIKVTHTYQEGSILELKNMSRSGPFYHAAGIEGNDYELLKPGKTYRMATYSVYLRDYPFPSDYVYIENFR